MKFRIMQVFEYESEAEIVEAPSAEAIDLSEYAALGDDFLGVRVYEFEDEEAIRSTVEGE
jgi:hypothetical protein